MKSDTLEQTRGNQRGRYQAAYGTRRGMADRETRQRMVEEALQQYPSGAGGIAWGIALREHPEWVEPLGAGTMAGFSRLRAFSHATLRKSRSSADSPETRPAQEPEAKATQAPGGGGKIPLAQRRELILEARQLYPSKGNGVSWNDAFAARPEWRTALGVPEGNKTAQSRLYAFTTGTLKNALKSQRKEMRKGRQAEPEESPQATVFTGIRYCPDCGQALQGYHQLKAAEHEAKRAELERLLARVLEETK